MGKQLPDEKERTKACSTQYLEHLTSPLYSSHNWQPVLYAYAIPGVDLGVIHWDQTNRPSLLFYLSYWSFVTPGSVSANLRAIQYAVKYISYVIS